MSTRRGIAALRALFGDRAGASDDGKRPPVESTVIAEYADAELALILHGDLGEVHAARIGSASERDPRPRTRRLLRRRPRRRRDCGRGQAGRPGRREPRRPSD